METRRFTLDRLYRSCDLQLQKERYSKLSSSFREYFGVDRRERYFSVSGRTEIVGNHTDHQHGMAVGGSVHLDLIAAVSPRCDSVVRLISPGYPECVVNIDDLEVHTDEKGSSHALIRGVAAELKERGFSVGGFDAVTDSSIPGGSGLSSSAAFEILICEIMGALYNTAPIDLMTEAIVGQYAENVYFGKPCGLLDQISCAFGGFSYIDFYDPKAPIAEKMLLDLEGAGYTLCITNTHSSHGDLTDDYAAVTSEMRSVANYFGKEYLREVSPDEFYGSLSDIRSKCSDRAILRAIHFFAEEERVMAVKNAAASGDVDKYIRTVNASGNSSFKFLQNVYSPKDTSNQAVSLALALSERILSGQGASRVHGGGFAGTIQAVVPVNLLEKYVSGMNAVFGEGACVSVGIRTLPSCEVIIE